MWARLKVPTRDVEAFRIYIQGSFNSGDKRRRDQNSGELSLRQRERSVPKVCLGLPSERDRLGLGWGEIFLLLTLPTIHTPAH